MKNSIKLFFQPASIWKHFAFHNPIPSVYHFNHHSLHYEHQNHSWSTKEFYRKNKLRILSHENFYFINKLYRWEKCVYHELFQWTTSIFLLQGHTDCGYSWGTIWHFEFWLLLVLEIYKIKNLLYSKLLMIQHRW